MDFHPVSLHSIRDLIRWGASRFTEAGLFFGHGTDNAMDESAQLVLHALHLEHDLPPDYLDCRLTPLEIDAVRRLLRRRVEERIPAAYITGQTWFAGLVFHVDENVLVPRSPFAELIENGLQPWVDPDQVHEVLDLCCGSGCIGISVAMHLQHTRVDLVDVSAPALAVARRNLEDYGLEERVEVIQSDLFGRLDGRRYDVILCNPPYVGEAEMAALPAEYLAEPALGLAGGADGLDLVRRILRDARGHLNPGGAIIVEVGNSARTLEDVFPGVSFTWIEFERGGEGVFLLTADQLEAYSGDFNVKSSKVK